MALEDFQKDSFRESSITYEGEPANTEDGVKEKAAEMALECICADYNISVNDHNYYALEVTKEKTFCRAQTKQWQFNMARQQVATQQNKLTRQTIILAKICNNLFDILPLLRQTSSTLSTQTAMILSSRTQARILLLDVYKHLQNICTTLSQTPILQEDIRG